MLCEDEVGYVIEGGVAKEGHCRGARSWGGMSDCCIWVGLDISGRCCSPVVGAGLKARRRRSGARAWWMARDGKVRLKTHVRNSGMTKWLRHGTRLGGTPAPGGPLPRAVRGHCPADWAANPGAENPWGRWIQPTGALGSRRERDEAGDRVDIGVWLWCCKTCFAVLWGQQGLGNTREDKKLYGHGLMPCWNEWCK